MTRVLTSSSINGGYNRNRSKEGKVITRIYIGTVPENSLGALYSPNSLSVQDDEHKKLKLDDSGLASCCIWINYVIPYLEYHAI